jgi:hypothetical protein
MASRNTLQHQGATRELIQLSKECTDKLENHMDPIAEAVCHLQIANKILRLKPAIEAVPPIFAPDN